jgi:D-alanine-D-alanine ligase
VIKPAGQGSALGLKVAQAAADVPGALVAAFSYDTKVLLERHVAGRDLAVSVLDGTPLPVVEAIPNDEAAYDFEHRYEIGATAFRCPAELPGDAAERAQEMAMRTWTVLGLAGVARVDIMLDASSDELWVLEANTIPGMTETSLLPMAADAAGIGFDQLIAQVLVLA